MPVLRYAALVGAALLLAPAPTAAAFGFEDVSRRAEKLAAKAYKAPGPELPRKLRDITYDQYRDIRFRPPNALWRKANLPFEVQFFHPGFLFQHAVQIRLVTADGVRPYPFRPEHFDYGRVELAPKDLEKLGYAGFRLHYPVNRPSYKDEVALFLGASYFRMLGRHQRYGLSARGLAIDTGAPSGEEFPAFTEFWIEWPSPEAREIVVYALLDSRRITGAYKFTIRPGAETVSDVQMRLFPRAEIGKLGIAPLTSMYLAGENDPATGDYRPEVHDSDGLSVVADTGEWIWRPLVNPQRLTASSFALTNPRGFGLMQRDRHFLRYEDLEARYELRPSLWIQPEGDWGAGRVELVQIPSPNEYNDNIVAFWVPDRKVEPGKPIDLRYRMAWQMQPETAPPSSAVTQTRVAAGSRENEQMFLIDFKGPALEVLAPEVELEADAWIGEGGELLEKRAFRNEAAGGWRMMLRVRRKEENQPLELRAFLRGPQGALSETWSYLVPAS